MFLLPALVKGSCRNRQENRKFDLYVKSDLKINPLKISAPDQLGDVNSNQIWTRPIQSRLNWLFCFRSKRFFSRVSTMWQPPAFRALSSATVCQWLWKELVCWWDMVADLVLASVRRPIIMESRRRSLSTGYWMMTAVEDFLVWWFRTWQVGFIQLVCNFVSVCDMLYCIVCDFSFSMCEIKFT